VISRERATFRCRSEVPFDWINVVDDIDIASMNTDLCRAALLGRLRRKSRFIESVSLLSPCGIKNFGGEFSAGKSLKKSKINCFPRVS
jgi:hypothetical protein